MYKKKYTLFLIILIVFSLSAKTDCWSRKSSLNVHWVFCLDTSGSMKMKGHMDLLKLITGKITDEFLDSKKNIINTGDRITIFSFDEQVRLQATSLYQTENDLLSIKKELRELNKRHGNLTWGLTS